MCAECLVGQLATCAPPAGPTGPAVFAISLCLALALAPFSGLWGAQDWWFTHEEEEDAGDTGCYMLLL